LLVQKVSGILIVLPRFRRKNDVDNPYFYRLVEYSLMQFIVNEAIVVIIMHMRGLFSGLGFKIKLG